MAAPSPLQPPAATVLVVDDEEMMRSLLCRTMESERYQVYAAGDGVEALALLDRGVPVDLVIADVSMPRMDGRQLVVELSSRHPHLPVVLISGVYLGGTPDLPGPVLPKPFTPMALASRVREVLALHQPLRRPQPASALSSDQGPSPIN
jgi:two-component system, cell cycle sensor histidine kinase and response regulator CckA